MMKLTRSQRDTAKQPRSLLKQIFGNTYVRFIIFGGILCLVPVFSKAGIVKVSVLTLLAVTFIYAISALGLNLLLGWSGLISLGTAGFMGLGAYMAAYAYMEMHLPFIVSILLAIVLPLVVGILVGLVSLRISGLYLAIATLCVAEILRKTFEQLKWFTGSFQGRKAAYPQILGLQLTRETTYVLIVVALVLVMMLTYNLTNGQLGRALHAMRGSEVAAQAMGVNLLKYRLMAFALATSYGSLAGALYVFFLKYTYPSTWNLGLSLSILAIVVIGGMRSIYGTVLGAFIVYAIPDLVLKKLPVIGDIDGLSYVFNGVLIILVVMFYPQGVIKIFNDIKRLIVKAVGKGGVKHE